MSTKYMKNFPSVTPSTSDSVVIIQSSNGAAGQATISDVISSEATRAQTAETALSNKIDAVTSGAPDALNTLKELADALGDDANFASTVTKYMTTSKEEISDLTLPVTYDVPVFTFTFDDGFIETMTRILPILTAKGITGTFGIVTSWVGSDDDTYVTKANLNTLVADGHTLASHSKTHDTALWYTDVANTTDAEFLAEMNDSKQWFSDNGFGTINTLIYPFANFDNHSGVTGTAKHIKNLTKQVYQYGLNADGYYNDSPNDQPYIARWFPDFSSGTDWATVKSVIDTCYANNGWLIFGVHPQKSEQFPDTYIEQAIDYIKTLSGASILNFDDALTYKKNIVSYGEFTDLSDGYFVGRNGVVKNNAENLKIDANGSNTTTMSTLLTSFAEYKTTITALVGSLDTIDGAGGLLFTYYLGSNYGYQKFLGYYGQKEYIRWWSGSAWNTWTEITAMPIPVSTNSYSGILTSPPSYYKQYKITNIYVTAANDTFKSVGGLLSVYHGDTGNSYQTFVPKGENAVYKSVWSGTDDSTGSWSTLTIMGDGSGSSSLTGTANDIAIIASGGTGLADSGVAISSLITTTSTSTLTNKSLSDSTTYFVDSNDNTKKVNIDVTGTTGIIGTLQTMFTTAKTLIFPDISDTVVTKTTTDILKNKSLVDTLTKVINNTDNTKAIQFDTSGITTSTTRTVTVPDKTGTMAMTSDLTPYALLASPALTGSPTIGGYNILRALSGGYKVQSGSTSITLNGTTQVSGTVTFPSAFGSAPVVITSLSDSGYGSTTPTTGIGIPTTTTTNFSYVLKNNSSATSAITMYWIAIGN